MVYILISLPEEVISEPISFCHYLGFKKLKIITNQKNQLCSNAYDDVRDLEAYEFQQNIKIQYPLM